MILIGVIYTHLPSLDLPRLQIKATLARFSVTTLRFRFIFTATSSYLLNLPLTMMRIMSRLLATIPSTARLMRMVASDSGSSLQLISQLLFLLVPLMALRLYWSRVDLMPGRITVLRCGSMLV